MIPVDLTDAAVAKALIRVFVPADRLDPTIRFYQALFGAPPWLRFKYEAAGLELAAVGGVLVLAGDADQLAPFRTTVATFVVRSIQTTWSLLEAAGAKIVQPPQAVPIGFIMRAMHPDGMQIEYMELTGVTTPAA